jgi:hypothetical protein
MTLNDTNEDTNEKPHRTAANKYLSQYKEGVLLPEGGVLVQPSFENFSERNRIHICEESAFILSKLTKEEFLTLIEQLALKKTPNLFEFWPDPFFSETLSNHPLWDVTKVPNEYTYYGKNPDMQIEMAARYENEKAFIRTKANVERIFDEKGNWRMETRLLNRR